MTLSRRGFLQLGAAGAGLLALPLLGRRRARAELSPDAKAHRLLVLNFYGGIRSSATLLASPSVVDYNPWGVIEGTGSELSLGKVMDDHLAGDPPLDDAAYQLTLPEWAGEITPRFRDWASRFAVLGTWSAERGDHLRARVEEVTGGVGDEPGLLVRAHHALVDALGDVPPAFQIEPAALFGLAPGAQARYAPVTMASPRSLPSEAQLDPAIVAATGNDFSIDDAMRERLDLARIAQRAGHGRTLAEVYAAHKRAARSVGARLAEPWVNVDNPEHASAAYGSVVTAAGETPLTNAMLFELFFQTLGFEPYLNPMLGAAVNAALGVRLIQLGSRAVVVEMGNYDLHSGERQLGPTMYSFTGRLWATLGWLLERMPDPEVPGKSLLDTTLIVTMSDFGRDPAPGGFNGGDGSDHGFDPGCYYLAHMVQGAGVTGGRLVGGVRTDTYDARNEPERFTSRQLLATTLWALGIDHQDPRWGFEGVGEPIRRLWG